MGIARFDPSGTRLLFDVLRKRIRDGAGATEFYEHSFQEMIDTGCEIGIVDTLTFRCIEIDTPEDLNEASADVAQYVDRTD